MSFDIFLINSATSPPKGQFEQAVYVALRGVGVKDPQIDGVLQLPDGSQFELFGGGMLALRSVSPSICNAIYVSALKSNSYIMAAADDVPALIPKGSLAKRPKHFDEPVRVIASPQKLCQVMEQGYRSWRGFAGQVHQAVNPD